LEERITDPSKMTTAVIHREISAIQQDLANMQENMRNDIDNREKNRQRELVRQEELFTAKLEGIKLALATEIKAINEASALRTQTLREIPSNIKDAVNHHEDLQKERFKGVSLQFEERDIRTAQSQAASAQALAAALQAAKELVGAQGDSNTRKSTGCTIHRT
jgi:hypothetical protein